MQIPVVRIGNSKGVRIPKTVLTQCHVEDVLFLEIQDGKMIFSPQKKPREGWEKAFRKSQNENEKDELLLPDFSEDWEDIEWDEEKWEQSEEKIFS